MGVGVTDWQTHWFAQPAIPRVAGATVRCDCVPNIPPASVWGLSRVPRQHWAAWLAADCWLGDWPRGRGEAPGTPQGTCVVYGACEAQQLGETFKNKHLNWLTWRSHWKMNKQSFWFFPLKSSLIVMEHPGDWSYSAEPLLSLWSQNIKYDFIFHGLILKFFVNSLSNHMLREVFKNSSSID